MTEIPAQARDFARSIDVTRGMRGGLRLLTRFGLVGALSFVVDVGTYNLARQVLELGPLTSKTLAVVVATTVAFLGSRSWTFADRDQVRTGPAYLAFFAINGVALLISLACLGLTYYVLGLTSPLAENVSSNVVGIGLGTLFRFWAYGRWVFPRGR